MKNKKETNSLSIKQSLYLRNSFVIFYLWRKLKMVFSQLYINSI